MKKITTILLILFFITGSAFAQKTNDGGSTGGNNKGNKPKDNTDGGGGSKSDNALLKITKVLFGAYQGHLLASSSKKHWITSTEIMLHGGTLGSSPNLTPRVKLNYGALSGDLRYDYILNDFVSQNLDALVEFNIIAGDFKMALGQGIMYSIDLEKSFHESFVGIDLGIRKRQIIISPEYRFVYDWNNKLIISNEFILKGGYRLVNMSKLAIYLNIAGGYRYFGTGNIVLNGGLDIIFQ